MVCRNVDGWGGAGVSGTGRGRFGARPRRLSGLSQGDRVEASLGEGMAAGQPAQSQPGAAEDTETDQRNVGVLRAGGQVDALRWAEDVEDRRQDALVDA